MKRLKKTNAYFFIGKCSKFSSVTLNFSEIYRNFFGSLKRCVTDITPSVTDITVCEFFLKNYIIIIMCTMMLKKLLISFIFMLSLPSAIYRSPEN